MKSSKKLMSCMIILIFVVCIFIAHITNALSQEETFEDALETRESLRNSYILSDPEVREQIRSDWEARNSKEHQLSEDEKELIIARIAERKRTIDNMSDVEKERRHAEYYGISDEEIEESDEDQESEDGVEDEVEEGDEGQGSEEGDQENQKFVSAFEKASSLSHLNKMETTFGDKKFGDKKFGTTRIFRNSE